MTKFKVGDIVKIIKIDRIDSQLVFNKVGEIKEISNKLTAQPYLIQFKGWRGGHHGTNEHRSLYSDCFWVNEEVIKLVSKSVPQPFGIVGFMKEINDKKS